MAIVKLKTKTATPNWYVRGAVRSLADLRELMAREGLATYPVDVDAVAKLLGLTVLLEPMDDELSGFLELRGDSWVAGINAYHHPVRRRFTLAHEVGHFVLHRDAQTDFRDRTFARRTNDPSKMERQADDFAADLLMPAASVIEAIGRGLRNLNDLAQAFNVSSLAMRYRLQSLGYSTG